MPRLGICLLILSMLSTACSKTVGNHSLEERQRLSRLHSQLSLEFILNQNINVARGEAEEALRLNRYGVEANHAMARVYQSENAHAFAIKHYQRALATDPNSVPVLNDYGQYLCERNNIDAALAQYDRAAGQRLDPLRMVSFTRAAACCIRHNRYQAATQYLLKALAFNPDSLPVLFNLAYASYAGGHVGAARDYLGRYLALTDRPSAHALALAAKLEKDS